MPYTKAKRLDKRNITKIFFLKLFEKIEIIDIILNKKIKFLFLSLICFLFINRFFL